MYNRPSLLSGGLVAYFPNISVAVPATFCLIEPYPWPSLLPLRILRIHLVNGCVSCHRTVDKGNQPLVGGITGGSVVPSMALAGGLGCPANMSVFF